MVEQLSSVPAPGDGTDPAKLFGGRSQVATRRIWGTHAGGGGGGAGNWIRSVFLPSSLSLGGAGEAKSAEGRAGDGPASFTVPRSLRSRDPTYATADPRGGNTPAEARPRGGGESPEGAAAGLKPGGEVPRGQASIAAAAAAAADTDKAGHRGGGTPILHASVANRLAPQVLVVPSRLQSCT